jgi:hypothetical protein
MKYLIFLLGMNIMFYVARGQKYISNDSIKYSIIITMPDFENGDYISDNILRITSIDSSKLAWAQSLSKKEWLTMLSNEKTDWAANLLLYQLNKRDALVFKIIKSRDSWIIKRRKADIAYWEKNLK